VPHRAMTSVLQLCIIKYDFPCIIRQTIHLRVTSSRVIYPRFPIHGRSEADIRKMVFGGLDAECVVSIQLAGDVQLMDIFIPRMLDRLPGEDGERCRQWFLPFWMQSGSIDPRGRFGQVTIWDIATDGQRNSSTMAKLSSNAVDGLARTHHLLPATTWVTRSQVCEDH